jgi:hypothetical protein
VLCVFHNGGSYVLAIVSVITEVKSSARAPSPAIEYVLHICTPPISTFGKLWTYFGAGFNSIPQAIIDNSFAFLQLASAPHTDAKRTVK